MGSRAWQPRVQHLLGVIPDAEIARRAGVSPTTVGKARAQLGIPVLARGDLASAPPAEVLRRVRARARAGKPMRTVGSSLPGDGHLADLCRYQFGGWYEAVVAAGLKPEGRRTPRPTPPPKKRGPNRSACLAIISSLPVSGWCLQIARYLRS